MDNEQLQRDLGRIESKVDILLTRDLDQEHRVSSLERSRAWFRGVLAVLALAWAAVLKLWTEHR